MSSSLGTYYSQSEMQLTNCKHLKANWLLLCLELHRQVRRTQQRTPVVASGVGDASGGGVSGQPIPDPWQVHLDNDARAGANLPPNGPGGGPPGGGGGGPPGGGGGVPGGSFDPWIPFNNNPSGGGGGGGPPGGDSGPLSSGARGSDPRRGSLRCKDFLGIDKFVGDLKKFADWSDRMRSKIAKSDRHYRDLLFNI